MALINKPYNDRLEILNLPALIYRGYGGNVIEVFKIITNKYDNSLILKPNILIVGCE